MRSGRFSRLHICLRLGVRASLFALAGWQLGGAAPAGALPTTCTAESFGIRCFDWDAGDGSVPDPGDPNAFLNSRTAEAQFQGLLGVGNFDSESFEGFAIADHGALENLFTGGLPVTGVLADTVDSGGSIRGALDDAVNRGFPTDGILFWKNETTDCDLDKLFSVTFDTKVHSFGFYASAWATESSLNNDATNLILELWADAKRTSLLALIDIPHPQDDVPGRTFYVGVISNLPFVAASLRNDSTTDPGDRIGFDDFTVAIVPEPATALMLLGGLLGLAAVGRRSVWRRPPSPNAAATIAGGAESARDSAPRRW